MVPQDRIRLCQVRDDAPKIAKMSQEASHGVLLDVIGTLEKEGRSGNYISNIVKPLKSWLAWNDIQITRAIKIPRSQPTKVENERPPTQEELKKILNAAELRAKVACSLVAFGGCRIEVLGNYTGDDGLKMKDLPEIKVENGKVVIAKVPTMVIARKTLSKAGHQYFTFLSQEGCQYLQEYLEWRLRKGEELLPETPVITFHERKGKYVTPEDVGRKHITSINIGDIIRKPIRKAGFDWRPYVLRRYFDVRMMMAEGDGLIIRDWREFWMGHKGDIEATYTVNKAVTQYTIEKMREAYKKCETSPLNGEATRSVAGEPEERAQGTASPRSRREGGRDGEDRPGQDEQRRVPRSTAPKAARNHD